MSKSPRRFSKFFKFNIVLESFVEGNASACASRHGVHTTQLNSWRKIFKTHGPGIFENQKRKLNSKGHQVGQLEQIIGKLTVENQVLKKTYKMLG